MSSGLRRLICRETIGFMWFFLTPSPLEDLWKSHEVDGVPVVPIPYILRSRQVYYGGARSAPTSEAVHWDTSNYIVDSPHTELKNLNPYRVP